MRDLDRVESEIARQLELLARAQQHNDPDVAIERPRKGRTLWMGEEEAAKITEQMSILQTIEVNSANSSA